MVLSTKIDPPSVEKPVQKSEPKKLMAVDASKEIILITEPPEDEPTIDFEPDPAPLPSVSTEAEEDPLKYFIFVEKNPEPINGFKFFYEQLDKNIKYPMQAKTK
jgi:hypothetical protein